MFNKIIIVGNFTRDIELRYLPTGSAMAVVGIASNRRFNKQDGTKGDETCFVDVKLFGRTAEIANQYLHKGSKVLIEGRLVYETWTDQSGQKRSKHSVVAESMQMLDSKSQDSNNNYGANSYDEGYEQNAQQSSFSNQRSATNTNTASANQSAQNYNQNIPSIDVDEDEIPF